MERPGVADTVKDMGVRYIVWLDGDTERVAEGGSLSCAAGPGGGGCFGFAWWQNDADYEAAVWDLDGNEHAGTVSADVSGTSFLPALVVPIPLIARTQAERLQGSRATATGIYRPVCAGSVGPTRPKKSPVVKRRHPATPQRPCGPMRCMHKAPFSQVQSDVRHLALDAEEQQVASPQFVAPDRGSMQTRAAPSSAAHYAGAQVGVLYEAAAIEAARVAPP